MSALIAVLVGWFVQSRQSVTSSERCANSFVDPRTGLSPLSTKNSALAATSVFTFAHGIVLNSRTQIPANTPKVSSASANWLSPKTVSAASCAKRSASRTLSALNPPCLWNFLKPQTNFNFPCGSMRSVWILKCLSVYLGETPKQKPCADVAGYVWVLSETCP